MFQKDPSGYIVEKRAWKTGKVEAGRPAGSPQQGGRGQVTAAGTSWQPAAVTQGRQDGGGAGEPRQLVTRTSNGLTVEGKKARN